MDSQNKTDVESSAGSEDKASFGEMRKRLDEIVAKVKDKDLSLEKSLDLYEEAIKIGNACAELVDSPDFTDEELAAVQAAEGMEGAETPAASGAAEGTGATEAADDPDDPDDPDASDAPDAADAAGEQA